MNNSQAAALFNSLTEGTNHLIQYGISWPNGEVTWAAPGEKTIEVGRGHTRQSVVYVGTSNATESYERFLREFTMRATSAGASSDVLPVIVSRKVLIVQYDRTVVMEPGDD